MNNKKKKIHVELNSGSSSLEPQYAKSMLLDLARTNVMSINKMLELALKLIETEVKNQKFPESWEKEGMNKQVLAEMIKEDVNHFVDEILLNPDPEQWKNSR